MEYEESVIEFKKYAMQTVDLLVDAFKWKIMADNCDSDYIKEKYMSVSDTLYSLYMAEHNNVNEMFKKD